MGKVRSCSCVLEYGVSAEPLRWLGLGRVILVEKEGIGSEVFASRYA